MSEPPYTPLTGKIKAYFDKIKAVGVPPGKVGRKWLRSVGFKGGNDGYIIHVWKFIGFVDTSNMPTELWTRYRDPTRSEAVLAQAIRSGYSDLFQMYDDAYRKDREAIYANFSSRTGKAETTINLMVTTFKKLCDLADFEAPEEIEPTPPPTAPIGPTEEAAPPKIKRRVGPPEIHINIQLHLPETTESAVYDNLFKSLKKHLFSDEEE